MAIDNKDKKVLNVPHLRFPEFSGEWKKHSLGEIGETIIGLTYKPSDVVDNNGIIVFRSSNIKNGMIDYSDLVRVNKHIKDKIITKENDILVCARNGSQRLIGKNAIIKQEDANNTFGAFMMVYRANDNPFILPLLSTKKYFSQVGENLGARINQITTSDFNGFEFYFPENHAERTKIAELFRLLDERIATQNKIIEDLKKLKCAIIEKLYTEIQGEEYSYGQLLEIVNERNKQMGYSNILSASQEKGMVNREDLNLDIQFEHNNISTYKIVREGDYVIHLRSFQGGFAFSDKLGVCSPAYTILRPNRLLEFGYLSYYFMSQRFIKSLIIVTYGIRDGRSINVEEWLNMKTVIPSKEHQLHILKVLRSIEGKIKNEETYATCLSNQKQYLLQQMFI
ncbi:MULTISPECIES: restriction endonuclease subunit S [Bacteroidales]|uniref:restriction endonuclease subunit S n=1 Tax=Bacteroidales TaxID=171549 RepID=UPI00132328E8|nr:MULTISPECIES: restriction endonuclease subunit S [Bacteroidales]MRZ75210.1 restriction endonuclease subunit S [Parabacteroides distasonis]MRZ94637.1 restriction endonuclease subunit S [Parabacteroides distasonis]MSA56863.1 restriction endonuclease subunit S [Parabacteroides distasonis]